MRYSGALALIFATSLYAADPPKAEELAPRAVGVALVEVVEVTKYDQRPVDGNAGDTFKLKRVRGSGEFRESVGVVTEFGGLRPPGAPAPAPSVPLKPDSLKKGDRYWIAFASKDEWGKHNQGVIGFWPEKDPKAESLEAAVKADAYLKRP